MKKSILICLALGGSLWAGQASAETTALLPTPEVEAVSVESTAAVPSGYVDKGTLATVYVDSKQSTWTITAPSPAETVIGIMPNPISWSNYGQLVITMRAFVLDLEPGQSCPVDVAVQLAGNQTGIYHIILTAY